MSETPPPVQEPVEPVAVVTPTANLPGGLAVAAFVLGLCGFIPILGVLLGLIAVILGIVALARSCGCGKKGLAIAGIVLGAVTMLIQPLVATLMVPAVQRAVELANQASCRANLKGIGTAIAMHRAEDPNGQFPKNMETLIEEGLVTSFAFECPSVEDGQRSYFWHFPKNQRTSGSAFLACDLKGNHPGDGRAILNVSGAVNFLREEKFQSVLREPENAEFAAAMEAEGFE
jgi:hypothetical protein